VNFLHYPIQQLDLLFQRFVDIFLAEAAETGVEQDYLATAIANGGAAAWLIGLQQGRGH
jgi:hypothetical protein